MQHVKYNRPQRLKHNPLLIRRPNHLLHRQTQFNEEGDGYHLAYIVLELPTQRLPELDQVFPLGEIDQIVRIFFLQD